MDLEVCSENGIFYGYYKKTKLSNGQTAYIVFEGVELSKCTEWNVLFVVANKRKDALKWIKGEKELDTQTGKCGLEGLVWAKNNLIEFENELSKRKGKNRMLIQWSDAKRKKVYIKYLKRLGYRYTKYFGVEALIKDA